MIFKNLKLVQRIFKTHVKKYFYEFLFILFLMIITAASTAGIAWLLDPAIKKIFIEKNMSMLYLIPLGIIFAFILKSVSVYFTKLIGIKISYKIVKSIQLALAEKILRSDTSYLIDKHSGKFISNFTNDTNILGQVLNNTVIQSIKEFITLIFLLSLMIYKDWKLSLLAITLIPIAALFSKKLGRRMGKVVTKTLEATDIFTKNLSEILKATSIIKIFQKEKSEINKFSQIISDRINKITKMESTRLGAGPVMETITGFAIALVVFAGGYQSIYGDMEVGTFFSFLTALMLAYQPVRALASVNIGVNEGLSAANRIYNILDNVNKVKDNRHLPNLNFTNGEIKFEDVDLEYVENIPVLKKINFHVNGGQKIALVGSSGSGKSSILKLIPRFYDPTNGSVSIDGQKINAINVDSLRKNIALVSQDIILFDDTIKANIGYGKNNPTDEDIIDAAKLANCHEFICKLENGYDTLVGENGTKLSGGQKQRISIARAMLKNSKIILLDEATSALDTKSEKIVQDAIENLTIQKTTIIVAHRLSTIKNVDKIFVVEDGKIVESGKHSDLINKNTLYKKLVLQQSIQ